MEEEKAVWSWKKEFSSFLQRIRCASALCSINALDMSADYLFKMDKHQADAKCEQVINMLMACDENQKDVVCRTMQTLIEAMRGEKNP